MHGTTNVKSPNNIMKWQMGFNSAFKGLMKGPKILRIELNAFHLYQHYSLFMHNKLQYTWRANYCECVQPVQLPLLTEVRAPSLLEQYPRYVFDRERAGHNRSSSSLSSFRRLVNIRLVHILSSMRATCPQHFNVLFSSFSKFVCVTRIFPFDFMSYFC
jgi:hypothetical protein